MTSVNDDDPLEANLSDQLDEPFAEQVPDRNFRERASIALSQLFQPIYNYFFVGRGQLVSRLEQRLSQAKISTPVELYITNAISVGAMFGIISGLFATVFIYFTVGGALPSGTGIFPESTAVWTQVLSAAGGVIIYLIFLSLWFAIFTLFGITVGYLIAIYRPRVAIYKRRREINMVMPDLVSFMYSLSVSGMDILEIFQAVADSEDTLGEAAKEFKEIDFQMRYFNTDYQTAIENVAETTPSDELSKFLIDLTSVLNSGGDVNEFMEVQKEQTINEQRRSMEEQLEGLEIMGEVYTSLTVLPLVLLVILIIMGMLGQGDMIMLLLTVYLLIPALNIGYAIAVGLVATNEVGNGELKPTSDTIANVAKEGKIRDMGAVDDYRNSNPEKPIFQRIRNREIRYRIVETLANPGEFFRNNPMYTLVPSTFATMIVLGALYLHGVADPSFAAMKEDALLQTTVWICIPFFIITTPLSVFYEWRARTIGSITDTLTDDLQKLANTNATGKTLLESIRITGEDNPSRLGQEFKWMYKRVKFGSGLGSVLIEFNNRYRIPRLARSVRLIQKAHESSTHITDVLQTAATLSDNQDELEKERKSRAQMQVVIILFSFFIFIAVLLMLQEYFVSAIVEIMGEDPDAQFADFGSVNPDYLAMLYLHGAMIQGLGAGFISGYVQSGDLYSGLKYSIALLASILVAWWSVALLL